jgi:hypothetical protein
VNVESSPIDRVSHRPLHALVHYHVFLTLLSNHSSTKYAEGAASNLSEPFRIFASGLSLNYEYSTLAQDSTLILYILASTCIIRHDDSYMTFSVDSTPVAPLASKGAVTRPFGSSRSMSHQLNDCGFSVGHRPDDKPGG